MIKDLTHNVPKLIYAFNSYLVRDCHGHNGARQTLLIPHGALSPGRERDIYAIIIQISTDCVMVPSRGWWWVAVVETEEPVPGHLAGPLYPGSGSDLVEREGEVRDIFPAVLALAEV